MILFSFFSLHSVVAMLLVKMKTKRTAKKKRMTKKSSPLHVVKMPTHMMNGVSGVFGLIVLCFHPE